jgi:hypothetical protein
MIFRKFVLDQMNFTHSIARYHFSVVIGRQQVDTFEINFEISINLALWCIIRGEKTIRVKLIRSPSFNYWIILIFFVRTIAFIVLLYQQGLRLRDLEALFPTSLGFGSELGKIGFS